MRTLLPSYAIVAMVEGLMGDWVIMPSFFSIPSEKPFLPEYTEKKSPLIAATVLLSVKARFVTVSSTSVPSSDFNSFIFTLSSVKSIFMYE